MYELTQDRNLVITYWLTVQILSSHLSRDAWIETLQQAVCYEFVIRGKVNHCVGGWTSWIPFTRDSTPTTTALSWDGPFALPVKQGLLVECFQCGSLGPGMIVSGESNKQATEWSPQGYVCTWGGCGVSPDSTAWILHFPVSSHVESKGVMLGHHVAVQAPRDPLLSLGQAESSAHCLSSNLFLPIGRVVEGGKV